jgi:hypothetical protein
MANPSLQITVPSAPVVMIPGTADVQLQGRVLSGDADGLFFKWYSTLNPTASAEHPELNTVSTLNLTTQLGVGSHIISLSAADRDGSDQIAAVTRAGFAGGAPAPENPTPCVIHRFVAELKSPVAAASVSRASATLEALAPSRWGKAAPVGSTNYVPDADYHNNNGIRYRFRFAPAGPADAAKTGQVIGSKDSLTFFIADDKPYVRWSGALPSNLVTGAYVLTLFVESLDGSVGHSVSRNLTLT